MIANLYESKSLHSLFRKSQVTIFAITFVICTFTFVLISIFTIETYAKQNLNILSLTVSERIQPALVFKDQTTLQQILNEYTEQHSIRRILIYDKANRELASSSKPPVYNSQLQEFLDRLFLKEPVKLMVYHHDQKIGELVLFGSSEKIIQFIITILIGLAIAMIFMVIALWWSTNWTYRYIMQSMQPLTQIAQMVSDQKAYNLRFPHNDIREFQDLNQVFNQLLEEIQKWHTHLQNENQQLSIKASHDHLTQLPNRSYFYQELVNLFDDPHKQNNAALIFIDNNNFKQINDQFGHLAGDAVLQEMAKRLKSRLRHQDFIARLGGDEFAVILQSIHQVDHLIHIAENLIASSQQPISFEKHTIHFSFSLGIAFSRYASTPEDLITQADQSMYKAKHLTHHWFIYKP
ncbi:sensor domain-containing diguanylate cyclase [Acinetobacter ihumii]|uniref:sensor domain-containing diguanylate cyclase n=1 Tax=Acinetobacter ihumii TaxID=2483802 RepID=UPI00103210F3|nr:sensor domain-containing diguanylate cyclase [Acinetobacter ihumii]